MKINEISQKAWGDLASGLKDYFISTQAFDAAFVEIKKRIEAKGRNGSLNDFSISQAIRGMRAEKGAALSSQTRDSDIAYLHQHLAEAETKALGTGTAPGSYLVPTLQAGEILSLLTDGGALRQLGPRVWPMSQIQALNVPISTATPTWEWIGQNTAQNASDPNFSTIPLNLKTVRGLVAIPNELLAVSNPAVDQAITELLAIGAAEKEDSAFFATTTQSGGPTSVYAATSTTTFGAAGDDANGGTLAYADILKCLEKAYTAKVAPPFVWAMHPRTLFGRIFGMLDTTSRPIVTSDAQAPLQFRIFGYPVVITTAIPVDQTLGSSTNASYILFTNPRAIHVGDSMNLELAFSTERYFSENQTAIRGVRRLDYNFGPTAAIVICQGVA